MDALTDILLETLAKVAQAPFTNEAAIGPLQQILGLNQASYRDSVTSDIYGELHPTTSNTTNRYKVLTMAYAVSKSGNSGYDYGNQFVKSGTTPSLEEKLAVEAGHIAVPLYRNYLEQGLQNHAPAIGGKKLDFLSLFQDVEFCTAFVNRIFDETFINDQLITIYLGGTKAYAESVAYIYERIRPTLVQAPPLHKIGAKSAASQWKPVVQQHERFKGKPNDVAEFLQRSLPLAWSNDDLLQPPSFPSIGDAFNAEFIRRQEIHDLAQAATSTKKEAVSTLPFGDPQVPVIPPIINSYGVDLVDWMNYQADHGYADVFNHGSAHQDVTTPSIFPSCFAPGTIVRTSKGDTPIESLQEGVQVLSKLPNQYGVVSNEKVMVPTGRGGSLAATTWLFGFNNENPFFTAGHIFFTKGGPKAIVPEAARQENPDIQVQQLSIGDVLLRLSPDSQDKYVEVRITRFTKKLAHCDFVYGLHFRKGDKAQCTYHANGYLVGLNYPEITLKHLNENFSRLSRKEQSKFAKMIPELPSSLRKVFGASLVNSFESNFAEPTSQLATYMESQKLQHKANADKRHLHPASLVRSYAMVDWSKFRKAKTTIHSHSRNFKTTVSVINGRKMPELSISHGALLIDGQLVPHARMDPKEIHWSRPVKNGNSNLWEHGMVKTSADGTFYHGTIAMGPGPSKSTAEFAADVKPALQAVTQVLGVSNANDYNLQTTIKGPSGPGTFNSASDADGIQYPGKYTWSAFHKVEVGMSTTDKGAVQVTATLPDLDAMLKKIESSTDDDTLYTATCGVDTTTWILTVNVSVYPGMEEIMQLLLDPTSDPSGPPAFSTFKMKVNLATNVVTGDYSELLQTGNISNPWTAGPYHPLYCPYSPKAMAVKSQALNAVASSPHQVSGAALALNTNFHNSTSNIHLDPAPFTTMLAASVASANDDLPIAFLQTMSTPPDVDLHRQSQNYMMGAAAYWRGADEITVFGNEKDAIAKSLPASLKDQLPSDLQTFIRDHFSKHLLIYSLSRDKNYSGKFSDAQKDKLQFWWTGKTDKCLSRMKAYNDVTVITSGIAFMELADDGFKPYVNSTTDYAQRLFDAVTDDSILNNLAISVIFGNQNLVNRYCAILNALDKQHRNLDTQLWTLVRDKQIMQLAAGSPEFGDDWSEFAQGYMKDLALKIASGDPSISEEMRDEMQFDLDKLTEGLDAKDATDLAFKMFNEGTDLGLNILTVIDQFKRRATRGGQANAASFLSSLESQLDKYPKLKAVFPYMKGIVMIGMQAYTIYKSIEFLMDWKNLSAAQKTVAILTCVETTLRAIYDCVQIYKEIRNLSPESLDFRLQCVRWNKASVAKVKTGDTAAEGSGTVVDSPSIENVVITGNNGEPDPALGPKKSMNQQIGEKGATAETGAADTLANTFSLSSLVVEGVMVALNVATVVMMGIELKNEWDHVPDGFKAMDTINLIVQCTQVITGVVSLGVMVAGAELVCLPVIGVLVALAGLVMMLVETFVPHPKPDPIQDYLNAHGYSYVDPLNSSPPPELKYSVTHTRQASGRLTIDITVSQPPNLSPPPQIRQLLVRLYAGTTDSDVFLPPTKDANNTVTANDIIWSIVNDNHTFEVDGANNPDPNDHSLVGRVYPSQPPSDSGTGTSVLGSSTLIIRIEGTPNPALKSMTGQVTEILYNAPAGVASTDVNATFTVTN